MIRVLHFVSTPAIWSGVMSVIMNYYRHIDRSSVQFDFLCFLPCEESYEKEIEELGGQVFFIPKPGTSSSSIASLIHFFREHGHRYYWLHNHEVYLSFLLRPLSLQYGIPRFIVHSHATRYSDRISAAFRNRIFCIPIHFMHCDRFACSRDAGSFLFGTKAMTQGRVYLLKNAIDCEKYRFDGELRERIRKQLGLTEYFVLGHVGRFVPQKNHDFLLSLFKELLKSNSAVRLLLIGDGPLKGEMERRCRKEELSEEVLFLGQRKDVAEFYSAMDLFVLPSTFEGVGIALLEAQANGLPAVASNRVPNEADVMGKVTFLSDNVKKWRAVIVKQMKAGPGMRTDGVKKAFQKSRFDIEEEALRLEEYYENTDSHVHL